MLKYETLVVEGDAISVAIDERMIHVRNDGALDALLGDNLLASLSITGKAKALYFRRTRRQLNVGDLSFAIEILGHLYPQKLATAIENADLSSLGAVALIGVRILTHNLKEHTKDIDIGESGVDSNRWVWDLLATGFYELVKQLALLI